MNDLQSGNVHTRIACVRDLIFSQDSIAHAFKDGTTYKFTIGQLVSGKVNPLEATGAVQLLDARNDHRSLVAIVMAGFSDHVLVRTC